MNHRSVRTTGSQTAKSHFEDGYKVLMKREKGKAEYESAIRLFDKVRLRCLHRAGFTIPLTSWSWLGRSHWVPSDPTLVLMDILLTM